MDTREDDFPPAVLQATPVAPKRRLRLPIGLLLVSALAGLIALNVAFDRLTPYTSETTLQAPVIGVVPNVAGDIVEVSVRDNQLVRAGDPLFRIDDRRYAAAVAQAQANLRDAGQKVGASTAALGAAEARVTDARAALANMREQVRRTVELVDRGVYPQARKDDMLAKLASAEAAVKSAESGLDEARRRLGPQGDENPAISLARAQLQRAVIDLNATHVVSPVDGVVTNTVLAPGQYAATGRSVATIVDVASSWIIANVPENMLGNIAPGDPVEIVLDAWPGRIIPGRVESIATGVNQAIASGLAGDLPRIEDRRRWLRGQQRIPVRIHLEADTSGVPVRVGARAGIIVYTQAAGPMAALGRLWIRTVSLVRFGL